MIENLKNELGRIPHQIFAGTAIRWQMILRVECGLSFCRGRLLKRKDFDWDQPREAVYRWLLIDLWYRDAMFWASRSFGGGPQKKTLIANDIRSHLWQLTQPNMISSN
jgi:hypothetical protein